MRLVTPPSFFYSKRDCLSLIFFSLDKHFLLFFGLYNSSSIYKDTFKLRVMHNIIGTHHLIWTNIHKLWTSMSKNCEYQRSQMSTFYEYIPTI